MKASPTLEGPRRRKRIHSRKDMTRKPRCKLGDPAWAKRRRPSPPCPKNFPRSTSAVMPRDNQGVAATVEEGTARKLVTRKCARPMSKSEDRGDSRKDGPLPVAAISMRSFMLRAKIVRLDMARPAGRRLRC